MPAWSIVLIVVAVVLIAECIIHRHVIGAMIHKKPFKAPKWHVWLPKKFRVS